MHGQSISGPGNGEQLLADAPAISCLPHGIPKEGRQRSPQPDSRSRLLRAGPARSVETMEPATETPSRRPLSSLSNAELVRRGVEDARTLVRSELAYAKEELREELRQAKWTGGLVGAAAVLGVISLSLFAVALGISLPMSEAAGLAVVGGALALIALVLSLVGVRIAPRRPLPRSQGRLKLDLLTTKERLA